MTGNIRLFGKDGFIPSFLMSISAFFRVLWMAALLVLLAVNYTATSALAAGASLPASVAALLQHAPPCSETGLSIRITVTNVKESRGIITADLHGDNPADFLKEIVGRGRAAAVEGETHICIPVKKPGIYAIALYHDRNSNLLLDKNFLGIPSEPIGISNNPPFHFGPPKFKDSAFEVTEQGADLVIGLRNAF
jgi:uncharacterized protein (DUF2141 family)